MVALTMMMMYITNLSVFFRMYDSKDRKRRMVTPRAAVVAAALES